MLKKINNSYLFVKLFILFFKYDYKILINTILIKNKNDLLNIKKIKMSSKLIKIFFNNLLITSLKTDFLILFLNNKKEFEFFLSKLLYNCICYKNQFLNPCDFSLIFESYNQNFCNFFIIFYYFIIIYIIIINNLIYYLLNKL
jgi:hypothetical protein